MHIAPRPEMVYSTEIPGRCRYGLKIQLTVANAVQQSNFPFENSCVVLYFALGILLVLVQGGDMRVVDVRLVILANVLEPIGVLEWVDKE